MESYNINDREQFSTDYITNPNNKFAVINSQIVNVTKTIQELFDIDDTTNISLAIAFTTINNTKSVTSSSDNDFFSFTIPN
jgi:hypothetical protein